MELLLSRLQGYLTQILIAIIVLLGALSVTQTVRLSLSKSETRTQVAKNSTLQANLDNQISVVKQLAEHGDEMAQRVQDAQQEAKVTLQKKAKEYAALQAERVPANCSDAAKWAASKSINIVAGW